MTIKKPLYSALVPFLLGVLVTLAVGRLRDPFLDDARTKARSPDGRFTAYLRGELRSDEPPYVLVDVEEAPLLRKPAYALLTAAPSGRERFEGVYWRDAQTLVVLARGVGRPITTKRFGSPSATAIVYDLDFTDRDLVRKPIQ